MDDSQKDRKLKLRYGKLTTPYKHFSVIAEGIAGEFTSCYLPFVLRLSGDAVVLGKLQTFTFLNCILLSRF